MNALGSAPITQHWGRKLLAVLGIAAIAACGSSAGATTVTYTKQVYRVSGAKIAIFSKPTDDSGVLRIVSGPKNSLWFGEPSVGDILRFSLKGVANVFTIPLAGASVRALAQGADGNIWFTDFNSNHVGRVTPGGRFKIFTTAANPTKALEMVQGPDTNLWFATDFSGIGRLTTKGKTNYYSISNNAYQPTAVTKGPGNEVWFAEWAGPNVGYVTTGGTVKEFNAGLGSFSNTFGIAYGSDGRIWFCNPQAQSIGAINTDGTGLTSYTAGLTDQADSIVAAPDGNLYFGTYNGIVGRITTAGKIKEYTLPVTEGNFPVIGIAVGPDGNIWFANNQHAQVGMLKIH